MITALVISALVCAIIWAVRYVRGYRAVTRELRSFPGTYIANPMPPTLAEIPELNGGFLIPPDRVASYVMNGSGQKVWLNEYGTLRIAEPKRTTYSPFPPRDAQSGDAWIDTSDDALQYRVKHVIKGISEWHPESEVVPGCLHPNPEPVVLTTDEVVAGVCPDCLQPLPPASVGSEWKP